MNEQLVPRSAETLVPTFYDEEMATMIKVVISYLSGPRGQLAINLLAQKDPELHRAITVTHHHNIPWHNLGVPGWKP